MNDKTAFDVQRMRKEIREKVEEVCSRFRVDAVKKQQDFLVEMAENFDQVLQKNQ